LTYEHSNKRGNMLPVPEKPTAHRDGRP